MKMAIINDSFIHVGGAEKVFLEFVRLYPDSDLFIPIINKDLRTQITKISKGKIHSTFFSNFPFFYKYASLLKPLLIFYWENLNLSKYKIIITNTHSFNSKLVNTSKKSNHISYVYTPPRYLDKNFNEMKFVKNSLFKKIFNPLMQWLKNKDLESGKKPRILIAISKTIKNRIKERYLRNSLCIYPPVKLSNSVIKNKKNEYYLCFSRLVKQKGIDLAVKTCTKYNIPLLVIGTGPELQSLKKIAGPTITFKGFVFDNQLDSLFSNAKALINCAIEEDFGMVTVEAASRGLPVIGFKSGGITETIVDGKTGVFFEKHTVESLITSIKKFEKLRINPKDCHEFAKRFSDQIFRKKIKAVVNYYAKKINNL